MVALEEEHRAIRESGHILLHKLSKKLAQKNNLAFFWSNQIPMLDRTKKKLIQNFERDEEKLLP